MRRDEFNHNIAMLPAEPLWGINIVKRQEIPIKEIKLAPYHKPKPECFAHFFIADDHFAGMWANPINALVRIKRFAGALSPDFSMPWDWPLADQLFNVRRNRFFGAYWQYEGLDVIPTASWGDERSYSFCFLGIEKHSVVAISTLGVGRNEYFRQLFFAGFIEMLHQIEPSSIICYGREIKGMDASCPISFIQQFDAKWQKDHA
jgi:hypothetical protein